MRKQIFVLVYNRVKAFNALKREGESYACAICAHEMAGIAETVRWLHFQDSEAVAVAKSIKKLADAMEKVAYSM